MGSEDLTKKLTKHVLELSSSILLDDSMHSKLSICYKVGATYGPCVPSQRHTAHRGSCMHVSTYTLARSRSRWHAWQMTHYYIHSRARHAPICIACKAKQQLASICMRECMRADRDMMHRSIAISIYCCIACAVVVTCCIDRDQMYSYIHLIYYIPCMHASCDL